MSGIQEAPWSVQFRREREAAWVELDKLVRRCERGGLRSLAPEQVARLPVLYRAALSSLGVARSAVLDQNLVAHLEALVARAYLVVYAPQRRVSSMVMPFLLQGFPAAVRSIGWHLLVAVLLLLIGAGIAFAMVRVDPEHYYLFLEAELASGRDPDATTEDLRKTLFHDGGKEGLLTFTAMLFTHNSSVGILCYGLGFAFGLPAALLLFQNGAMLGAMSALFHDRGLAVEWWSWILPHGVTELLAILLCGAAGLAVAQAMVFPGDRSRLDALAGAGRRMALVVAGSVLMLLLAGFIEGVFRQVVQHVPTRYTLAGVSAVLWAVYFLFAGRRTA